MPLNGNTSASEHQPLIIIADDDPSVRLLLKHTLEKEGYLSLEAGNGNEALALFRNNEASMVLLDAAMPEVDGFETCRQIKQNNPDLPVIMITSLDDDASVENAFDSGANDYVTKPINWSILKHRIIRAMSGTKFFTQRNQDKLTSELDHHQYSISIRPRVNIDDEKTTAIICDYYHLGVQHNKLLNNKNLLSLRHSRQLIAESCVKYKRRDKHERFVIQVHPFGGSALQYTKMLKEVLDSSEVPLSLVDCVFSESQLTTNETLQLYLALSELPVHLHIGDFSFSLHTLKTIKSSRCEALEIDIPLVHSVFSKNHASIIQMLKAYHELKLTLVGANITTPEQLETSKLLNCTQAHGPAIVEQNQLD